MTIKLITRQITNIILITSTTDLQGSVIRRVSCHHSSSIKNINRPRDLYLRIYFTNHKYLGGSKRSAISDKIFNITPSTNVFWTMWSNLSHFLWKKRINSTINSKNKSSTKSTLSSLLSSTTHLITPLPKYLW